MVVGMLAVVACMLGIGATPVWAVDLNLVSLLTQNLGVTTEQAEGGAGRLDAAFKNMSTVHASYRCAARCGPLVKNAPTSDAGSGSRGTICW